jgi:hypothetical protein
LDYPKTIKNEKVFNESAPPGFDGIFDWSWLEGCFGNTKIMPMDIDAIVERKGNFLIFETKHMGVPVPQGQMITLKKLVGLRKITVMIIHGKKLPERFTVLYPNGVKQDYIGLEKAKEVVTNWFNYADKVAAK